MEDNENNDQFKNYPEPQEPTPEYKSDNIKTVAAILLGVFIGGIAVFLYILAGGTSQFMSDQACNVLVENASNISFSNGVDYTVYQISTSILENGIMPRFVNNSGVISVQYLQMNNYPNWTIIQPQLNPQEVK